MTTLSVERLVLDPSEYARLRPQRRQHAIQLRRSRRVHVGDLVTIEFENAETLTYQAQEMLYVEKVTDESAVAAELAAYERMLPGPTWLTATMLVEIPDQHRVRAELERLSGLHDSVLLEIGAESCAGRDVPPPDEGPASRTFSVHFLRFDLPAAVVEAMRAGEPARLRVEHPEYAAVTELPPETLRLLLEDLGGA